MEDDSPIFLPLLANYMRYIGFVSPDVGVTESTLFFLFFLNDLLFVVYYRSRLKVVISGNRKDRAHLADQSIQCLHMLPHSRKWVVGYICGTFCVEFVQYVLPVSAWVLFSQGLV